MENQKGVGDFIMSHTHEGDRIFVFGLNLEEYYLSGRDPATKRTFLADEMCNTSKEIYESVLAPFEINKPKYIVVSSFYVTEVCGNGSRLETAVRGYMNENYIYANSWGPIELYERKGS